MSTERRTLAFISLLRDELEARGLAGLLDSLARSTATVASVFLVPDVRGIDFFAAASRQPEVDRWWGRNVPPSALPVYLLYHQDGLADWLYGLDGIFLVAAERDRSGAYAPWTVVGAAPEEAPLALAEAAITQFGLSVNPAEPFFADVFDPRDARMVASMRTDPGPGWVSRPALPPLLHVDGVHVPTTEPGAVPPDPLELLVAESARSQPLVLEVRSEERTDTLRAKATSGLRSRLPLSRVGGPGTTEAQLASRLVRRSPMVVVVGSRKGGVGKTSHAAGMAIVAGSALDSVGHRAAIVDANVANPDAWGHLSLPAHAATVRDVVNALTNGTEPPLPVHSVTPALACYPERRDGVEYSRTDIRRLAAHLRARYAFTVVDMSNRLPDPTSGPEAAAAAYWLEEADALVLPTASSRQDFNGVLDYLEVSDLPPTVVPYIVSSARRNRRHPVTRRYLEVIGSLVESIVEIPDEADSVRLAGLDGIPVQNVSPRMRAAYRELTEAVARLPKGVHA